MDTPYVFEWLEQTTSTQDVARSAFSGQPVVVGAARQTAGRGRDNRRWETAPRALAVSVCFRPLWEPKTFGSLPLLAGLAATDVVEGSLKWPNDIVDPEGRKLGGILCEATGDVVTIGLGLNLMWPDPPDGYGGLFTSDPGQGDGLAKLWSAALLRRVSAGPGRWGRDQYIARCVTLGRNVTWQPEGAGFATGIGVDGELLVVTAGGRRELVTSEVWHVRSTGALAVRSHELDG